jgi:predicted amidophosphoribosyltransferase
MSVFVSPYVHYLGPLRRRMNSRGFPHADELLRAADKAYNTARDLSITLHYLSCKSGVGRAPSSPQQSGPFAAWARFKPR